MLKVIQILSGIWHLDFTKPSITDWISATGTFLGVPAAIFGIFRLFKKDIELERKLTALESISASQNDLVDKMQVEIDLLLVQTGEFKYQSTLMFDHNKLIEKQIEDQANLSLSAQAIEEKKIAIEQQKRLIEIKPYFTYRSASAPTYNYFLGLLNKGQTAQEIWCEILEPVGTTVELDKKDVGQKELLNLTYQPNGFRPFNEIYFKGKLNFKDVDGNEYYQLITVSQGKLEDSKPVLRLFE